MLDGFQYALAQIGVVVVITALLAGLLGWLIGRSSRRRTEKAFEQAIATLAGPEPKASPFAPVDVAADSAEEAPEADAEDGLSAEAVALPLAQRQPYGTPLIEHVPLHEVEDPDATIIRPAPGPKTTPYVPPSAVISSTPIAPSAKIPSPAVAAITVLPRPPAGEPVTASPELQRLRQELHHRDLELGRVEAGALSAWDRTVPQLELQIDGLTTEIDSLRRRIREAEEHSDADARTVDHLRGLVADRDTRIAELRAPA